MSEEHLKWLWAAYRRGGFADAPKDLDAKDFEQWAVAEIVQLDEGYLLSVDKPVGLVLARLNDHRMEPHVWWFPWATPRNKLECAVKFLSSIRFKSLVMIPAAKEDWSFYEHLLRYGMMKVVGKVDDYFGEGEQAKLFQTRGYVGV